jgi:hypothetical protein
MSVITLTALNPTKSAHETPQDLWDGAYARNLQKRSAIHESAASRERARTHGPTQPSVENPIAGPSSAMVSTLDF